MKCPSANNTSVKLLPVGVAFHQYNLSVRRAAHVFYIAINET